MQRVYANPQNGLFSLQQVYSPPMINETKFGYNGSKTRINGAAPSVNGIDMSSISVDQLHRNRCDAGRRRPGCLGRRFDTRRPDPLEQFSERPRSAVHKLHDVVHR